MDRTEPRFSKWLICLVLLCAPPAMADPRVIIIGDSISEHIYCWPNELRTEHPLMNIQLMTQSGRTIRDFEMPRDLRNVSTKDVVIYFLGTNDAHGGYPMRFVNEAFVSHMVFLQAREFRIIVLLPPLASALMPQIKNVRTVVQMQTARLGISNYNLDELGIWQESMTMDGIHPTPELSREVARFVYDLLESHVKTGMYDMDTECQRIRTQFVKKQ